MTYDCPGTSHLHNAHGLDFPFCDMVFLSAYHSITLVKVNSLKCGQNIMGAPLSLTLSSLGALHFHFKHWFLVSITNKDLVTLVKFKK